RRRGTASPSLQNSGGSGLDAAGQPRLRGCRRLHDAPQGAARTSQSRPAVALCRGTEGDPRSSAGAVGIGQTSGGAGGLREPDPRRSQRLLGQQPSDRPEGRGSPACAASGGVVRAEEGGGTATAARTQSAPGELPSRDRLAGAQARRVCRLPVSGGPVPQQPVSRGV